MGISLSGLGSGTDWSSLIDQLVAVERQPADKLTADKTKATTQLSVVGDLLSRLGTLTSAAGAMTTTSSLWGIAATSSDSNQVKVTSTGSGTAGSFAVRVEQLARGESRRSQEFASSSPGLDGSVSIGVGGGTAVNVSYAATDNLADIAAKITKNVPGVTATALYDGSKYRLMLSSSTTGATAGKLTINESGAGLGLTASDAVTQDARDARISLNGVVATAATNHMVGVVPGVTIDVGSVTAPTAGDVTVTLAQDASSLKSKISSLVTAYNSVTSLVGTQLSYGGTKKGTDTLFGDLSTQRLQARMGSVATAEYGGDDKLTLRGIGITMGPGGQLSIDSAKLDSVLASDPGKVEKLLTGEGGLADTLSDLAKQNTATEGPYVAKQATLQARMKRDDEGITRINSRADDAEVRLKKQFAALDEAMSNYNSQLSFLSKLSTTT